MTPFFIIILLYLKKKIIIVEVMWKCFIIELSSKYKRGTDCEQYVGKHPPLSTYGTIKPRKRAMSTSNYKEINRQEARLGDSVAN